MVPLNLVSIYDLGLKLLDLLEVVHGAGYVYNDLSLENVVLDFNKLIEHRRKIEQTESVF